MPFPQNLFYTEISLVKIPVRKDGTSQNFQPLEVILMRNGSRTDRYGNKFWYKNDKLHRIDVPAVEWASGHKEWWIEGKRHRIDGPAVESANGQKEWWVEGKFHRSDGPAVESANGHKKWWIDGIEYTEQEFLNKTYVEPISRWESLIEDLL